MVTGHSLKILVLHKEGNLHAIILDAEAAQMQSLGDVLLMANNPAVSGLSITDPLDLVLYVAKTCCTHFFRYDLHLPSIANKKKLIATM